MEKSVEGAVKVGGVALVKAPAVLVKATSKQKEKKNLKRKRSGISSTFTLSYGPTFEDYEEVYRWTHSQP